MKIEKIHAAGDCMYILPKVVVLFYFFSGLEFYRTFYFYFFVMVFN